MFLYAHTLYAYSDEARDALVESLGRLNEPFHVVEEETRYVILWGKK